MQTRRWQIDGEQSSIVFRASSSIHPIRVAASGSGWFEADIGSGEFADGSSLAGRLEIPVAHLSSGNPLIDREMKRRIDVDVYPNIVAEIEATEHVDGSTATVTGRIGFVGAETLVEGDLTIAPGPRVTGIGEFDMRWWGLRPPRILMVSVDPIVTIEVDLLLA